LKQSRTLRWIVAGLAFLVIVALALAWRGYPRLFELSWEEEVWLHDGRVVVVGRSIQYERLDRWSKYDGTIARKETLRFTPEGESQQREVSFPNLRLFVFDVYGGVNYLVLTPTSGRSRSPEDSPFPVGEPPGNYRVLRWTGDRFVQIPLKELPLAIVGRNLSWDDSAPRIVAYEGKRLSVPEKELIKSEVLRPDRTSREVVR
jgi:hypothetical protein